jgi:hypothetical protein
MTPAQVLQGLGYQTKLITGNICIFVRMNHQRNINKKPKYGNSLRLAARPATGATFSTRLAVWLSDIFQG